MTSDIGASLIFFFALYKSTQSFKSNLGKKKREHQMWGWGQYSVVTTIIIIIITTSIIIIKIIIWVWPY